jgi:hypothetical protein
MHSIPAVALDPVGNVTLSLQVAILFLLILGLPFVRAQRSRRNLMWHGYLTVVALGLHTILILLVMTPSFTGAVSELSGLTLLGSVTVWSHAVLGTIAEVLAIVLVAAWLRAGPSKMACAHWKRWMMPTFIIWTISLVNGTLVHIFGSV